MSGNKQPYIDDPEEFDGNYVGGITFGETIVNEYDLRAFVKYKHETGREWKDLSEEEKHSFKLEKYK